MSVKLNGHEYRVVRLGNARVVISRVSPRQWRLAPADVSRAIMAGFQLRIVA
jgi:hypothetical protein